LRSLADSAKDQDRICEERPPSRQALWRPRAASISSRCSPRCAARNGLIRLLGSSGHSFAGGSEATRASVSSARRSARRAASRGGMAWINGRVASLIQVTSSGSTSDGENGTPRSSLAASTRARASQKAMCASTAATDQCWLTGPRSWSSLMRSTNARSRSRSRVFRPTYERSTDILASPEGPQYGGREAVVNGLGRHVTLALRHRDPTGHRRPRAAQGGTAMASTSTEIDRDAQGARRSETKGVGRYADVNGIELYYEIHGTGRPLILLHGGLGAR